MGFNWMRRWTDILIGGFYWLFDLTIERGLIRVLESSCIIFKVCLVYGNVSRAEERHFLFSALPTGMDDEDPRYSAWT